MRCNFNADIDRNFSQTLHYTPSTIAKKLPFYLESWGHYLTKPSYFVERQALENFQLIYSVNGSGELKYQGKEYTIHPKQLFLIDCSEYHFYQTGTDGFWETKWMHFNGTSAKQYCDLINEDAFAIVSFPEASSLDRYLNEIPAILAKNNSDTDIKLAMYITNILSEILFHKKDLATCKHAPVMDEIIRYIQKNFSQAINTESLWSRSYLSKYHFLRAFKNYTGVSPYHYLTRYRINHSKSLLKETTLSIREISEQSGFNDVNNYIREFKKLVGTTPLKYRNYWMA